MTFEQLLRAHLEDIAAGTFVSAQRVREIDAQKMQQRVSRAELVGSDLEIWSRKLPEFLRFLETLPAHRAPTAPAEARAFALRALDEALREDPPALSSRERWELTGLQDEFLDFQFHVDQYAVETYLVRVQGQQRAVTQLGHVFQRLRGRDAVRWLLTNEVLQSVGAADPWRVPRELLEDSSRDEAAFFVYEDDTGTLGYSGRTIYRLKSLGVLIFRHVRERPDFRWVIWDSMRELVGAVLEPGPWHAAVRALLDDERAVVLPGTSPSAREATIEQTKLIAHEVRNALIPVRYDLDALRSGPLDVGPRKRVDNAREGVVRVLDFVETMVQASEMITEPAAPCDLGAVVEEALGWIDTEHRVERLIAPALHVIAPRTPLTRAISNVVGNALQATPAGKPIRLLVKQDSLVVLVVVDDGGPGVPLEHRRRVFQEGVTMRKDGAGSGFGLAYAQRVVEGTLHGRIWCEDSDLGGARFVIELPDASSR